MRMSKRDAWIRNPKGLPSQGKYEICEQDLEDYEQEKLIQEWLKREGRTDEFESKYISRKGTARNTIDKRSIRLDAQISDEHGSGTYADIIAGSDGRDLECRGDGDEVDRGPAPAAERLESELDLFLDAIGVTEGVKAWAKKSLKSAESLRSLRSLMKEDERFETLTIDLESLPPLRSFRRW
jgi:hypothetical protein